MNGLLGSISIHYRNGTTYWMNENRIEYVYLKDELTSSYRG